MKIFKKFTEYMTGKSEEPSISDVKHPSSFDEERSQSPENRSQAAELKLLQKELQEAEQLLAEKIRRMQKAREESEPKPSMSFQFEKRIEEIEQQRHETQKEFAENITRLKKQLENESNPSKRQKLEQHIKETEAEQVTCLEILEERCRRFKTAYEEGKPDPSMGFKLEKLIEAAEQEHAQLIRDFGENITRLRQQLTDETDPSTCQELEKSIEETEKKHAHDRELLERKLERLKQAYTNETGTSVQDKLMQEIAEAEQERQQVVAKLKAIEEQLTALEK